jgi:hypothetical protein
MITGIEIVEALIALGTLYLVASPRFGERAYHSALFAPWKYPKGNYHGELGSSGRFEDVYFPATDGKKLHGWFFQGAGTQTIIVNHGKTGNITDLERLIVLLVETGASVLIYDYRGFGRSEGSPSLKVICEDGIAAYKWLVETKKTAPENIIAYGESLGGGVACYLAEHTEIGGLILQSVFGGLRKISIENMPVLRFYPDFLYPKFFKNSVAVSRFSKPVLLLHGALDEDICIEHSHDLLAAANQPKELVILPNTLHDEISEQDSELFLQTVRSFLSSLKDSHSSTARAPHTVNS